MAMIPKKVKTSKSLDTGGMLEKTMVVLIVILFVDTFLTPHIHKSLSPLMYVTITLVTLYLIFPNKKNYGLSGHMRLILMLRYQLNKLKERTAIKA